MNSSRDVEPGLNTTNKIVTINTLYDSPGGARAQRGLESVHANTKEKYDRAVEKIEAETRKSGANVLITVQDAEASMLQSAIAAHAKAGSALKAGGFEAQFGEGFAGGDW